MAVVNKFNVNREQVTLDADIIENMSANDVSYDSSTQYDENTVGNKLSELETVGDRLSELDRQINGIVEIITPDYDTIADSYIKNVVDIPTITPSTVNTLSSFIPVIEGDVVNFNYTGLNPYGIIGLFDESKNGIINQIYSISRGLDVIVPQSAAYIAFSAQNTRFAQVTISITRKSEDGAFDTIYKNLQTKNEEIKELQQDIDDLKNRGEDDEGNASLNLTSEPMMLRMIDAVSCEDGNMPESVEKYDVISSGEDYIELSATDAAKCTRPYLCLTIRFRNQIYKNVWFVTPDSSYKLYRADFEYTDLTDANSAMAVFDTPYLGKGLHLSCYGYRSYAEYVADYIKRTSYKGFSHIGGLNFTQFANTTNFNDKNIYDTDGNVVCSPNVSSGWLVNRGFITSNQNNSAGVFGWSQKAYVSSSNQTDGNWIEFPLTFVGKRGYVEFTAAARTRTSTNLTPDSTMGYFRAEVYVSGVKVQEFNLTSAMRRYVVDNIALDNVAVRFVNVIDGDKTKTSLLCLYDIQAYELNPVLNDPSYGKFSKIAMLGDSWTQFPTSSQPSSQGVSDDADFIEDCELVVRPDGTEGNGYGFFPKHLARVLNCKVDNWGKSDQTTESWGLPNIDKILMYDNYDAVIIEFFLNDNKYGMTFEDWRDNLHAMALKCIRRGVRPIILMPNKAASGQAVTWVEQINEGLGDMKSW